MLISYCFGLMQIIGLNKYPPMNQIAKEHNEMVKATRLEF